MVARVRIELYGSLGATGRGHGTDVAVLLGLCGHLPDVVDPAAVPGIIAGIRERGRLSLLDRFPIDFTAKRDLSLNRGGLPRHSNGNIGRESVRERVGTTFWISGVAAVLKKKQ